LHEIRDEFHVGRPEQFAIIPLGIDFEELRGAAWKARATPERLSVVGCQLSVFRTTDNRQLTTRQELVVGIVGRITAIKNHDMFLRVAERLRGRARFVVYGDGADREALERRAMNVEFAGTLDARDVYKAVDIVALTSRNEGTPLALIEAMACGKPIVSTAVGGVVDLLGDVVERRDGFEIRERGLTAASDDDAGFASALALLLEDETLRRRLSERGITYAEKSHSKERLITDILALYSELAHS
ncbi:MAG TPA: glycosyltransferase family 4 protein, partial [Thermoanaerobaculia bacterium]